MAAWKPEHWSEQRSAVMAGARRRHHHVLLVEDDHVLAEMYKLGLLLDGFEVDVAPDGEAGIQRVTRGQRPDVIVLDLGRPRIDQRNPRRDSLELLATVRSTLPTDWIPVVVLSSDPLDFKRVLDGGATACLPKWRTTPFDLTRSLDGILRES